MCERCGFGVQLYIYVCYLCGLVIHIRMHRGSTDLCDVGVTIIRIIRVQIRFCKEQVFYIP